MIVTLVRIIKNHSNEFDEESEQHKIKAAFLTMASLHVEKNVLDKFESICPDSHTVCTQLEFHQLKDERFGRTICCDPNSDLVVALMPKIFADEGEKVMHKKTRKAALTVLNNFLDLKH